MLAIYTRLSKEDSDSTSIKNQTREGQKFAKDKGFNDLEIYNEGEGVSGGAEIKDRPQLFQLLQDFRENKIKAVWFRNQNRLERNSSTYAIFISEAQKYKVEVYFSDRLLDFDNPSDNLLGTITSAVNQYQKDLQAVQTKRSLIDNVKEGKVWSVVAYGYKSDKGYLAIDETESKIVKEIYDLSLSGVGTDSIANRLNQRGIPTRKNKLFRGNTIQGIIKNSIYKGQRVYGKEVFDCPLIIEPNYWKKVNNNLANNRNNSGKKVEHKYLLKGVVKCGKCGRNYFGRTRVNGKDNFYACSSKRYKELNCDNKALSLPFLENLIWGNFFAKSEFKTLLNEHFKEQLNVNPVNSINIELDTFRKALKVLKNNKEKFLNLVMADVISNEDIKDRMRQINTEISDIGIKITNLEEEKSIIENNLTNQDAILEEVDVSNKVSFKGKRELILKYIDAVVIYFDKELNGYFIEIKSKIGGVSSVYFTDYLKRFAHTVYGKGNIRFMVQNANKPKDGVIKGQVDFSISAIEKWENYYSK
jgi:DNA invertase Pin-like site-specific DNA recombinase